MMKLLQLLPGKKWPMKTLDGAICLVLLTLSIYYNVLAFQQPERWYQALLLGDVPASQSMQYSNYLMGAGTAFLSMIGIYCFLRRYAKYTTVIAVLVGLLPLYVVTKEVPSTLPPLLPFELVPNPTNMLIPDIFWIFLVPSLSASLQGLTRWLIKRAQNSI